ncbi:MAG: acyl-CoA/acyl-ACP dehydrogenase [Myxococcales bacterium]|nr:acyl-CoA/acyl-ACP dehydrogenase [Myxococcales bacterium]
MDFAFTEEQEVVRDLAAQILADRTSHERSKELETSGVWYDDDLWAELVRANLPSVAIPEAYGGSGFGIVEVCLVLEEIGRHCAPVPLFPTLVLGGLAIDAFGSDEQKQRLLAPVAESGSVLSAALEETGSSNVSRPRVTAKRDGGGWLLDGEKVGVPAARLASAILVPAATGEGAVGVFILDPNSNGVAIERQTATHFEPLGLLRLSGARVGANDVLGDPQGGAAIVEWILDRALLGISAMQVGVCASAIQQTATYLTERKQFDKPIGAFQGVQLRAADAFIDLEAMRAVLLEASWRLSEGLRARAEIAATKWWAARGGDRVVNTAQHLHGGIGSDIDYPVHRTYLWAQHLANQLGGSHPQLARLGAMLVSENERPTL